MTGRELNDLAAIFPERDWFDLAVMENVAVLFHPATLTTEALADPPPSEFVARLHERGLPLQLGLEPAEVAGVGDAENDYALLDICWLSVAVRMRSGRSRTRCKSSRSAITAVVWWNSSSGCSPQRRR